MTSKELSTIPPVPTIHITPLPIVHPLSYFKFVFSVVPRIFQFFIYLLLNFGSIIYSLFLNLVIYLASRNTYGTKHE
jgi:hypothetical protein